MQVQKGWQWFFLPASHKKETECKLGLFKVCAKEGHTHLNLLCLSLPIGVVGIHLLIFINLFNLRESRFSSVLRAWEISINKAQQNTDSTILSFIQFLCGT